MNKSNKKGFTLAELLIVVAIIAVLVAIAIPVFTSQMEKAREAVDAANLRAAYAQIMANALTDDGTATVAPVKQTQTKAGWTTTFDFPKGFNVADPEAVATGATAKSWTLSYNPTTNEVTATLG